LVRSGIKEYPEEASFSEMAADIKAAMLEAEKQRAILAALDGAAALRDRGEFTKAAQLLEQALVKAPGHAVLQEQLAVIKEKIATQQKVNVVLDEVFDLMTRGEFSEAFEKVNRGLAVYPGELALSSLLEEVKRGQHSHAVTEACQEIESLRSAGNLNGATRRLKEILARFPGEPAILALQTRIQAEVAEAQKRQRVEALTAEVRRMLDQQRVDEAIQKLQGGLREYPEEGELLALLAYCNEIVAARRRTDAVNDLAKRARSMLQSGRAREAEVLLNKALHDYPDEEVFFPLLKRTKEAIEREQTAPSRPSADTVVEPRRPTPAPAPPAEPKRSTPAPATDLNARVRNPERLSRAFRGAIGLAIVIVLAIVGWWMLSGKTDYQEQFAAGKSYFEQKDFTKAIETLQQIPSNSPLYRQAQDLLAAARNGDKQKAIVALVADATSAPNQHDDAKAQETIKHIVA